MRKDIPTLSIAGAVLASVFVVACASTKPARTEEVAPLVWPDPPQMPRIEHVRSIRYLSDLEGEPSWFGKLMQGLFGRSREKLIKPYGLATDSLGRIYVADTAKRMVYRLDLEGETATRYTEFEPCGEIEARKERSFFGKLFSGRPKMGLVSPIGVAVDQSDNFYVSDSILGRVFAFDERGRCLRVFGANDELLRPSGVAVNKRLGRLYVTDAAGHKIVVFDLEGNRLFEFGQRGDGPGAFNFPTNIFVGADDNVYVTDSLNFRVEIFTAEGDIVNQFGQLGRVSGSFNKPKGIAVDSEGHIYVVDSLFDNVQIFDAEGRLLLSFGEPGIADGEFWLPSGIFIDGRDNIYVSDSYNTRVQVFKYLRNREQRQPR
jgi:DNA-binding beta-propeller fold protein YncE